MKTTFHLNLIVLLVLGSTQTLAIGGEDAGIRFKTGEMEPLSYLEMVSDAMGIQINASDLDSHSPPIQVTSGEPMTREQAMSQVLTALRLRGQTLIHDPDLDTYSALRFRDAMDANIPFLSESSQLIDNDRLVIYPIRLKHFPSEAMARILRSWSPATSRLVPVESSNTLFITDLSHSIINYRAIIERFDTPKAAAEAHELLQARTKPTCPSPMNTGSSENRVVWIALFSLIGLMLGFLMRGYVIRRIEGGL